MVRFDELGILSLYVQFLYYDSYLRDFGFKPVPLGMHFYHLFRVFEFSGIVRKFLLQNSLSLSFLSSYTNFIIILPQSREDLFLEETRRLKNSKFLEKDIKFSLILYLESL
jgi:hypothetical protein